MESFKNFAIGSSTLIFFMLALLFVSPLILAETNTIDVQDVFKSGQTVDYKKPCFNNGTYCSSSATCNYTMYYPNNDLLIDNKPATNKIAYYNYTFVAPATIGIYKVDMTCIDVDLKGSETYYFEVTGSGFNNTIGFYFFILLVSAGIIISGFMIKDAWIAILGTFGLYFLGIYIILNGIMGMKDFVTTWATGIILLGIAGYISVNSAMEVVEEHL